MTARERIRREVNMLGMGLHERFTDATYRLGFVVRTVKADSRRSRMLFEYGADWRAAHPSDPTVSEAEQRRPRGCRVTSTGQRLSRVV